MAAVLQHGILVTTSTASDQQILSYTVAGSNFTALILTLGAAFTSYSATEAYLGFGRFQFYENGGSGWETKDRSPAFVNTDLDNNNPLIIRPLGAGQVFTIGQKIRGICTPATATSIRWACSIWGNSA